MRNAYAKLEDRSLEMLADKESMSTGRLGRSNIAKHQPELSLADAKQNHSASFQAPLNARDFAKKPMDRML